MSPGAKVQGRQNEAYKTFTRVKTIVDCELSLTVTE